MLRELAVQNLALIEDVRVELAPGFCAWTGETGAGKSLLLGAIGLLLGDRGSADIIRAGQDELRVTGRFELSRPEQRHAAEEMLQTKIEENELILTRRLSRNGRSSALVNEHPVSVATLRRLGEMLVDVHGQRESYSLLQPAYQLELLDAFGKLTDLRNGYVRVAETVRNLRRRHKELSEARLNRQRELSLVRFERVSGSPPRPLGWRCWRDIRWTTRRPWRSYRSEWAWGPVFSSPRRADRGSPLHSVLSPLLLRRC